MLVHIYEHHELKAEEFHAEYSLSVEQGKINEERSDEDFRTDR
jgi:hypothetical protein